MKKTIELKMDREKERTRERKKVKEGQKEALQYYSCYLGLAKFTITASLIVEGCIGTPL